MKLSSLTTALAALYGAPLPAYFIGVESDPKTVLRNDTDLTDPIQYLTGILYLAPAGTSGYQTCPNRSAGCEATCLFYAGRGGLLKSGQTESDVNAARRRRTELLFRHRTETLRVIDAELTRLEARAARRGLKAAVRLNGTSDLPWEAMRLDGQSLIDRHPAVQFYDYTKDFRRMARFLRGGFPFGYWLTFSASENNLNEQYAILAAGGNVATPFRTERHPETWLSRPVLSGVDSDLRFHDGLRGRVIALCAKGKAAKADRSGFIVDVN